MKKIFLFITVFTLSISISVAATARSEIQYLVKKYGLSDVKIGISAQRTMSGDNLYAFAKDRELKPASNNKVFTIVGALFAIPSDFRFTTTVNYPEGKLRSGVLYGDMYMKFSGDPSLTGAEIFNLVKSIKTDKGIKQITGNVYLVGAFSGSYVPEGWSKEDETFCYGSPASSFTMNRNCMIIKLAKNSNSMNTRVIGITNVSNIDIQNTAVYTSANKNTIISMDDRNNLVISGYLSRAAEKMFKLSIRNPALKTLDTVDDFMKLNGIKHGRILITSKVPDGYPVQLENKSATIGSFIDRTLKKSDNLYAETILNTIGLHQKGIGSTTAGVSSVQEIINNKLNLNTSSLIMYDGSGLSHLDSVTPDFMVNFLTRTYNSPVGKKFYHYLPASGMSGTISYRMGGKMLNKVHAKTGTLSGVSSLSGYVLTSKAHQVSFSIIINDLKASQRTNARRFQDKVVEVFYNYL